MLHSVWWCILVYSLHSSIWKLYQISVRNVRNYWLNLIHPGNSQKNMSGKTEWTQKLLVSLRQQNLHWYTHPWKHWPAPVTCTQKRARTFAVQWSCPHSFSSYVPQTKQVTHVLCLTSQPSASCVLQARHSMLHRKGCSCHSLQTFLWMSFQIKEQSSLSWLTVSQIKPITRASISGTSSTRRNRVIVHMQGWHVQGWQGVHSGKTRAET